MPRDVHLVGSIPLGDAREVFQTVSAALGAHLRRIPDGENGDRSDDAYFSPLSRLRLRPETELSMGLVHYTEGVAGTRKRLGAAEKQVARFSVATDCGFGRRNPSTTAKLLRIHAEVTG